MRKKLKILAAGDIHGSLDIAKRLSSKAKKNKVDLVVLAGDIYGYSEGDDNILGPFQDAGQKVVFVPGNCDFDEEHEVLKREAKSIHNYYVTYGDVGIVGIGNPNWKLCLDKGDLKSIKKNFSRMKSGKKVLVSHLHAGGTKAEFSGIPGDDVIRDAVEEFEPDLLIAAHIHEGEGIEEKVGKTRVVQVGRAGKVIEI